MTRGGGGMEEQPLSGSLLVQRVFGSAGSSAGSTGSSAGSAGSRQACHRVHALPGGVAAVSVVFPACCLGKKFLLRAGCPTSPKAVGGSSTGNPGQQEQVYEDYNCTLNQTNISANNNKFYIIQLLEHNGAYSVWSRWGRVGEVGQFKLMPCASLEAAKKDFEKKFREKTKNSWASKENFIAQPGKYTLIEVQPGAGQEVEVALKVLADIEVAQSLQAQKVKEEEKEVPHPLDQDYALLCCQLSLLDSASREYQLIQNYVTQTGHNLHILNIWQVARAGEDERFKAHNLLEHRRLLWHGTNVAVVAAILKSGLRIMPHSGGRVGKGIYFASENSKSACYGEGPGTRKAAWDARRWAAHPRMLASCSWRRWPWASPTASPVMTPRCVSHLLAMTVSWPVARQSQTLHRMRRCCWMARRCWCAKASPSPCLPTRNPPSDRASTSSTRKASAGSATLSSSASEGAQESCGPGPAPAGDAH
ncbi:protein mono-ADP-ribosyltransferase PARP3 isoform X7 [Pseudopipra pipra]|uniref:protein mono-ADP-ribosyltransferase PARP3 isoform X7 n=1 Tax=Pseudopipra pipra TaxID=415032 RepID=UPI003138F8C3